MTIEQRVDNLERQMRMLQNATLQASKNAMPQTKKIDEAASNVQNITPWTSSKTAYIEDTECIFNDVPSGTLTVYCPVNYTVERMDTRVTVKFEPLENVIEITISII